MICSSSRCLARILPGDLLVEPLFGQELRVAPDLAHRSLHLFLDLGLKPLLLDLGLACARRQRALFPQRVEATTATMTSFERKLL